MTTVEEYLRAEIDYPFADNVLKKAALSPVFAKPVAFRAIALDDIVDDNTDDEDFVKSLKYATSTLYYSAAGAFSGGSISEQVGDVRASKRGFVITQRDRDNYRAMGDMLRRELGAAVDETQTDSGGMFDARDRRKHTPKCRRSWN